MPDIQIAGTTTNPALPSVLKTWQQIRNLPGYKAWLRAQDGFTTRVTSGGADYISAFADYGGAPGVSFVSPEASPKYAKRVTDSIGGFEAAYFADADDATDTFDRYDGAGFTFDWQQSWTMLFVAQADASMLTQVAAMMGIGATGADTKVLLGTSGTGNLTLAIGSAGTINLPMNTNPMWGIASFYRDPTTPANSKLSFEVNGQRGADVTRAPIAAQAQLPVVGAFGNSQPWKGVIRELLFLQQSAHYGAAPCRELLRKHAMRIYGFAF